MPQAFAFKPPTLNPLPKQVPRLRPVQRHAQAHDAALSLLTDLHQGPCVAG